MIAVTIICARCGVPVRMTSLGCYGHLAPQVVGQDKPHAARPAQSPFTRRALAGQLPAKATR